MEYALSFGRLDAKQRAAPGPAFRLALLGDFSGRAASGTLETGAALAARKPIKVDVDNFDQVLSRLMPKLIVGLGDEGAVTIPIRELDDFHPDQLVENLEIFEQLLDLRRNLQSKSGFDRAAKEVLSWSGEEALPAVREKPRGVAVATDRKLSDFARLVGRAPREEAAADDLIRRLVGPFVVPSRDQRQDALIARVDEALSAAMRRVLHSPEFQTAEALWRSVDLLVRRVETGARMQIVLYDVSAEELAADLASAEALDQCGLYGMLVEQPALDENQGPLSLIAGLYQWELTPPHAELLGRMALLCGGAGAPFLTGIGPDALKEKEHDWHPLIRKAWTALRQLPAASYLGVATPRFLLRMPFGKRSDPIDAFAFEEFTRQGGLSGMLWGNPAVLVALTLAETWARDSKTMKLGSVASVDELPVYVYRDADGDTVALPCTERLFAERLAAQVASVGVIPVVSLRGRPEVRVASFNGVSGKPIAGRWAPVDLSPPPPPKPPKPARPSKAATSELDAMLAGIASAAPAAAPEPEPELTPEAAAEAPVALTEAEAAAEPEAPAENLDALLASLDQVTPAAPEPAAETPAEEDLDALLASLNAEPEKPVGEDETEPDLDALLASLK